MKSSHRLAALVWLGMVLPFSAQSSPVIPREVVLYVQDDLPETSFVDPLVCALERVLRVPVRVETSRIQIGPNLLLRGRQYDVAALACRLSATEAAKDRPAFRHLIVRQDVAASGYNFLFAHRFGEGPVPERVQVASTARLRDGLDGRKGSERADALAARLYKIILRGIVHGAGYPGQGCVLAYANSYGEFSTKTLQLCPEDREHLVRAGLVRRDEKAECAPAVASRERDRRRAVASLDGSVE